ncbi:MAG: beta-ketoacyl-[acyl-carrier-protein] synthase family protein [Opitutaceae bacterium]|nr:beta-ketoacyl-[acyl-carrier-protein] synthase family protein [Opitutaceae bacterium]
MKNDERRVAVTGLGLVTALGHSEPEVWSSLLAGRCPLRALKNHDYAGNKVCSGGEIDLAEFEARVPATLRRADRTVRFAVEAARQAMTAARCLPAEADKPEDIATIFGSGCGPTETLHASHTRFAEKGPAGMRPSSVPNGMANAVSAALSIEFRLTGANYTVVSACTSATNAIGIGFRMVREGHAAAVLCGGTDNSFDPFYYALWNNLGVFSPIADPQRAVRPFAADRAGTLLGEGAGALVLESFASARRRGVRIRGEIVGYGESSDATHLTGPSATGQAAAIRAALRSADVAPHEIGYISAHGTGTDANDLTEAQAIRIALGDAADSAPVGATKSYFGHTLGASGAIETIGTLLALEHGVAPGNLNLEHPDPACPVSLVGAAPQPLTRGLALKNSFGFGGGNAVLVLRRYS